MTERPEPYSAIGRAILAAAFCARALLTLPPAGQHANTC
jgi:hypothetical protein